LTQASTLEYKGIFSSTKFTSTDRTTSGSAANLIYKFDTRDLAYSASLQNISKNFFTETGYLSRNGIFTAAGLIRPKFYPDSSFIQRIDIELVTAQTQDKPSGMWETYNYLSG